jgi:hypothetical protein
VVVDALETAAGAFLLFVAPGYAWTRAVFPEWRFAGPDRWGVGVRVATLTFVWSIAIDIVVGSVLTEVPSLGFSAAWSDPKLEVALVLLTAAGLVAAVVRGAFRPIREAAPAPPGVERSPLSWMQEADRLARDEARLRRQIRRSAPESPERSRLESELQAVSERLAETHRQRERELAQ